MCSNQKGIYDHAPISFDPKPLTPTGIPEEPRSKVNWGLILGVVLLGCLVGYGIKSYIDSREKERRYSNL